MSKIIHLHNKKNGFLSAHNDHVDLRAESHEHSVWTLEQKNGYSVLKAYNGHFLSADAHGVVRLHPESDGDCHLHVVEHDQENKIAIKDGHNNFITSDEHGHVKTGKAHDDQPNVNQWFHVEVPHGVHNHHGHAHHAVN